MNEDCNLDQWLCSAIAAMMFATENWPAFCKYTEKVIKQPVPISSNTMMHHVLHLERLIVVERIPE
jgi:hypothetical protein